MTIKFTKLKHAAIPAIRSTSEDSDILGALKDNIEMLTGTSGTRLDKLSLNATTTDLIKKINEILVLLQG